MSRANKLTEEEKTEVIARRHAGETQKSIAETVHLPLSTIWDFLKSAGLTMPKQVQTVNKVEGVMSAEPVPLLPYRPTASQQRKSITALTDALEGYALTVTKLGQIHSDITPEERVCWVSSIQKSNKEFRSLIRQLKE